jgi:hypothetical protein
MSIFLMITFIILSFAFIDWHARMVFMARAYPRRYGHGKSWKRAHKHYKTNWTFLQRMLWIPMFKEVYEDKYRFIAYLSYVHVTLTLVTLAFFIISVICFPTSQIGFPTSKIWFYEFIVYSVFFILRFIYDNAIARGEI